MAEPKKAPKKAARPGHAGLTKEQRRKIEAMGRGALEGAVGQGRSALKGIKSLATSTAGLIPAVGAGAMVEGGAKALAKKQAKKKANKAWKAGTVDLKGGGKVHRAGLARRRRS